MAQFVPDRGRSDALAILAKRVVPALVLILVFIRVVAVVIDYRQATGPEAETVPAESTASAEATGAAEAEGGSADEQQAPPDQADGEARTVVVIIPGLNFRTEPKGNADVITTLPNGAELTLLDQEGAWYHVRTEDGTEGWVSASDQYVRVEE